MRALTFQNCSVVSLTHMDLSASGGGFELPIHTHNTFSGSDRTQLKREEIGCNSVASPLNRGSTKVYDEVIMSENMKSESVSRRGVFGLFGLAVASCIAVPAAVLTATDAEAVVGRPGSPVSLAGANRRDRRQDRRYKKKK